MSPDGLPAQPGATIVQKVGHGHFEPIASGTSDSPTAEVTVPCDTRSPHVSYTFGVSLDEISQVDRGLCRQADLLLGKKPYDHEAAARLQAERKARKAAAAAKRKPRSKP